MYKSVMARVPSYLAAIATSAILCVSMISGCQQTNAPSGTSQAVKKTSKEKILYRKNEVAYETDLSGTRTHKLFSLSHGSPEGPCIYLPDKRVFLYTTPKQQDPFLRTLREYSLATRKDRRIDDTEFILASADELGILYTRPQGAAVNRSASVSPNRLFRYVPGKGVESLNIENVHSATVNTATAELCYVSFTPTEQMTESPSKMYVTGLDNLNPKLIRSSPAGMWAIPVAISKENVVILAMSEDNAAADSANLYLFDRKSKQTRLIEDKVMMLAHDKERKALLVAEKNANSLTDFSIWEISYETNTKTRLFQLSLRGGEAGPLSARYSPDGKYIAISNGWDGNLGLYDFSSKRYKLLSDVKGKVVRDFIFTSDGNSILYTVGKPLYDSSISKDVVYKTELASGNTTAIIKPSKAAGNEIIQLIGIY